MLNTNQTNFESSFECAELEFQLFISKFQVEAFETVDDSSHPVRYQLNSSNFIKIR